MEPGGSEGGCVVLAKLWGLVKKSLLNCGMLEKIENIFSPAQIIMDKSFRMFTKDYSLEILRKTLCWTL